MSNISRKCPTKTKYHKSALQTYFLNAKCIETCNPRTAYFIHLKMKIEPALTYVRYNAVGLISVYQYFFCPFLFSHLSCTPCVKTAASDNNKAGQQKGEGNFNYTLLQKISSCRADANFFF